MQQPRVRKPNAFPFVRSGYEGKLQEVKVIDDTEEETVTDEPIIRGGEVEQINEPLAEETEALPEQDDEVFVSPVYRQYLEAQKINPQAVVLLRVGDFYEVMGENARAVAEELDLTLTSRDVGLPERVPMCGFPYHVTEVYIEKILARHGVLLAEDGQEPKYILSHAEALQAEQAEISEEPEQELSSEIVERDEDEIAELQELFSEEEGEIKDPELIPSRLLLMTKRKNNPTRKRTTTLRLRTRKISRRNPNRKKPRISQNPHKRRKRKVSKTDLEKNPKCRFSILWNRKRSLNKSFLSSGA